MACFCHKLSQFHICSPQQRPIRTRPTPNRHPKHPKHPSRHTLAAQQRPIRTRPTPNPRPITPQPLRNPIQTLHTTPASYVLVTHYVITNATQVN